MNFDRVNRIKAFAFALLRRDKSAAAMAKPEELAKASRANTQRADRKIGGGPRKLSEVEPLIDRSGVRQSLSLPCQIFVAVGVKAWKSLVTWGKRPSDRYAVNIFSSTNWRKSAFLQPRMRSGLQFLENFSGVYPGGRGQCESFPAGIRGQEFRLGVRRIEFSTPGQAQMSDYFRIFPGNSAYFRVSGEVGTKRRSHWVTLSRTQKWSAGSAECRITL